MQKTWFGKALVALCGWLLCTALASAEQEDAAQRLTALLADVHTIKADFEQLSMDANGASIQELQGQMLLKKPGKFVWTTAEPMPQELVSDGTRVWLYDPDLLQVTIQDMDERMTHTPALLLSGESGKIRDNFTVSYHVSGAITEFSLLPKDNDTLFDRLRLGFRNGQLNDMHLEDAVGQKTSLYFFNVEMNLELDDDNFVFVVPAGVDVFEE